MERDNSGIDLAKLAPAPWSVSFDAESGSHYIRHPNGAPMLLCEDDHDPQCLAALAFAALARNALDIMLRRGGMSLPTTPLSIGAVRTATAGGPLSAQITTVGGDAMATANEMATEIIVKLDEMVGDPDVLVGMPWRDEREVSLMVGAVSAMLARFAAEDREAMAARLESLAETYEKEADGESLNASLGLSGRADGLAEAAALLRATPTAAD